MTVKRFFSEFLLKTCTFLLLNLPIILVYFVVAIVFKLPILDELIDMLSDKSSAFAYTFNALIYFVYVAVYYLILYLTVYKNNSAKVAYLNSTANKEYSFIGESKQYLKSFLLSDALASVLVSAVSFAFVGLFNTNKLLRLVFITEYSLTQLVGIEIAAVLYALFTTLFVFFAVIISQYVWNKNRLGGKA